MPSASPSSSENARPQVTQQSILHFSEDDPENPKNWPLRQRWVTTVLVSAICFMTPATSSMVAPALDEIAQDLHITSSFLSQMILSIFVLGLGCGPIFLGPLSEIYGRVKVLLCGNLMYLLFNTLCGIARSSSQMLAFRFLAGFGGSAPVVVGSGIISDLFRPDERGKAISIFNICPLLSPSVGPVVGAFVMGPLGWSWIFYIVSIGDAVLQIAGWIWLRESYAPILLARRRQQMIKEAPKLEGTVQPITPPVTNFFSMIKRNLFRAMKLLFTEPILQILALYLAYVYGLIYLAFSTFPILWETVYRESTQIGSLNYISLGLGYTLGSVVCGLLSDRIYRRLVRRLGQQSTTATISTTTSPQTMLENSQLEKGPDLLIQPAMKTTATSTSTQFQTQPQSQTKLPPLKAAGKPEFKLPLLFLASFLIPTGLLIYGWTAQHHVHWIGPNIGAVIFSNGISISYQCISGYIVDTYPLYAASAVSAVIMVRNIPGFVFPLFAPAMYQRLGFGWGNSLLAFLAVGVGIPATFGLWIFGPRLRGEKNGGKDDDRDGGRNIR